MLSTANEQLTGLSKRYLSTVRELKAKNTLLSGQRENLIKEVIALRVSKDIAEAGYMEERNSVIELKEELTSKQAKNDRLSGQREDLIKEIIALRVSKDIAEAGCKEAKNFVKSLKNTLKHEIKEVFELRDECNELTKQLAIERKESKKSTCRSRIDVATDKVKRDLVEQQDLVKALRKRINIYVLEIRRMREDLEVGRADNEELTYY